MCWFKSLGCGFCYSSNRNQIWMAEQKGVLGYKMGDLDQFIPKALPGLWSKPTGFGSSKGTGRTDQSPQYWLGMSGAQAFCTRIIGVSQQMDTSGDQSKMQEAFYWQPLKSTWLIQKYNIWLMNMSDFQVNLINGNHYFIFKSEFNIFHSISLDIKWQLIGSHIDRPFWA